MSPRTLRVACALSILLNIFLIAGVVASLFWLHQRRPMIAAGAMRVAGAELPREERRAFREALRTAREDARPLIANDRKLRDDAAALLRAPSVDQAALAAALAKVREADVAIRAHVEERAIGFIATLPPEDRAKLAEGMERRGRPRTP